MSENLLSDEPKRLAGDASYDLAFPGCFIRTRALAQNDVLMNLNALARPECGEDRRGK